MRWSTAPVGALLSHAWDVPPGGALGLEFADGRVSAVAGVGAMSPKRPQRRTKAPNLGADSYSALAKMDDRTGWCEGQLVHVFYASGLSQHLLMII